jgi:hypothetical protein
LNEAPERVGYLHFALGYFDELTSFITHRMLVPFRRPVSVVRACHHVSGSRVFPKLELSEVDVRAPLLYVRVVTQTWTRISFRSCPLTLYASIPGS